MKFHGLAKNKETRGNKKCKWTEIHVYRFNNEGKICEHWVEFSQLELMMQIEAVKWVNQ